MASWSAPDPAGGTTGAAVRISVDAMGGDHGPAQLVPAALD
jgi:hypothetical protein